jgi:hypothetical protein
MVHGIDKSSAVDAAAAIAQVPCAILEFSTPKYLGTQTSSDETVLWAAPLE